MDYINHNGNSETWALQSGDYCFEDNSSLDAFKCQWNRMSQSEDETYMFSGETTPVKAFGDLANYASNNESMSKCVEECREPSSRAKRRRVLQFDCEVQDGPHCNERHSSAHPRSNEMGDSVEEALSEMSRWLSDDSDGTSICGSEALDQLFQGWISNCLNDTEIKSSPTNMHMSSRFDLQNNTTELCNKPPGCEATIVQSRPVRTRQNVIFKGRKSYMQTTENSASSVVYPFAIVKPCSFHGDVTLKDINQRIHAPSRFNQIKENQFSYPTSAFSGKPVVAKTRICTEGGKGSITIMRTKG